MTNLLTFDASHALVLVASANPSHWHHVKEALGNRFAVAYAVDLQGSLEILRQHHPALVVLGGKLLDADLERSLQGIRPSFPRARIVVIGGSSALADAAVDEREIATQLLPAILELLEPDRPRRPAGDDDGDVDGGVTDIDELRRMVVGRHPRVQKQLEVARRAAPHDVCCLITGESGTGKEVLARWIHALSPRASHPFVAVDLPTIPAELFESILFGHERGSFTGAVAQHEGKFQRAQRGTLFLDEVSSLRTELQPKLLRALQEKEIESVGGKAPTACDARIIAATNVNLAAAVKRGEFRGDLFYRLCVVTINLVPLRDRPDDIPAFVDFFCKKHAGRFGREAPTVSAEALAALGSHDWSGNIRELENRVQRAVLLSTSERLERDDFFGDWLGLEEGDVSGGDGAAGVSFGDGAYSLAEMEALYIEHVLRRTDGNQSQAAQLLQIDRKTLRNKLQKYLESDGRTLRSVS